MNNMRINILNGCLILFCLLMSVGCNDELQYASSGNARLTFQKDTVKFDKVFTTIGSSTIITKVYNKTNEHQLIRQLSLANANHSGFRVNVDGVSGTSFENIEIRKKDSLYVFIEVTVDPQNKKQPVLIKDSLVFQLNNGIKQDMKLYAYGQDVIILKGKTIDKDTTFTDERPILIYDSLRVNKGFTLTLNSGVELYFHDKIDCKVHGTLKANGTLENPIIFAGDRQDRLFSYLPYAKVPGQWGGVRFYKESFNNHLNYVDIQGGIYGIKCDSSNVSKEKIKLENSIVHNVSENILSMTSCKSFIGNSELTNSGETTVELIGGESQFLHCTIANFMEWGTRKGVAVAVYNVKNEIDYPLLDAQFTNCIITGFSSDELSGGSSDKETVPFNYLFTYSLVNTKLNSSSPNYSALLTHYPNVVWDDIKTSEYNRSKNFLHINKDRKFRYDFRLVEKSPARNIASLTEANQYSLDRLGRDRISAGQPDAGCYQFNSTDEYIAPED